MIVEQCHDIDELRDLLQEWEQAVLDNEYNLDIDLEVAIDDLKRCMFDESVEGDVLVVKENDKVVALLSILALPSFFGKDKIAIEKYWYSGRRHSVAGPKLYVEAVKWAKEHGCSHLITCGNKTSPERHDSICRFLEKTGAQHFETAYIYQL